MREQRRRRGRSVGAALIFEQEAEFDFQIAPMADLLFVLLVFFMSITSLDSLRLDKHLTLPVESASDSSERSPQLSHQAVVSLGADPKTQAELIQVDGRAIAGTDALLEWLRQRRAADVQIQIVLRADQKTAYSRVAEVMRLCGTAHIDAITFVVAEPKIPDHRSRP